SERAPPQQLVSDYCIGGSVMARFTCSVTVTPVGTFGTLTRISLRDSGVSALRALQIWLQARSRKYSVEPFGTACSYTYFVAPGGRSIGVTVVSSAIGEV